MSKFNELQKLVEEQGAATGVLKALLEALGEQDKRIEELEIKAGIRKGPGPSWGDELTEMCSCKGCDFNLVMGRYGPSCPCCEEGSGSGCGAEEYNRHCASCKCEKCKPHQVCKPVSFTFGRMNEA
jgi:hypothetical protein